MSGPTSSPAELDYLAAGERLRERLLPLKAQGLKEVFVATDMAAAANLAQVHPAIHILYQGERPLEGSQSGRVSHFEQSWLVLLVHRATPNQPSAGVWMGRILQAVAGRPYESSVFSRAASPARPSYQGGVAFLPLAFNVTVKFKGER